MDESIYASNWWAAIVVDQLARCGLRDVCIAPGSRSTPLTLAFDQHPDIKVYLHLDERSASFFALGLAQASRRPVAVVCTSGTAAVEFHPAIVEAYQAQVPLLVLTADRPPELRHSGANQTIDQVKMYGGHVLWAVDTALPEAAPPAVALRNLRTVASRAYAIADGLQKGPVHLNLPFRKPLEPENLDLLAQYQRQAAEALPLATIERGSLHPSSAQIAQLAELIERHERGWIVCGPYCPGGDFPEEVYALAEKVGYPLLADPLSGVRFGPHSFDPVDLDHATSDHKPVVGGYETFLARGEPPWEPPEVVLRFGAVPTSKWLNAYLEQVSPRYLVHVHQSGIWADDSHQVTYFLQAEPAVVCRHLSHEVKERSRNTLARAWSLAVLEMEQRIQTAQQVALAESFIDASVIPILLDALPDGANLFVGNSLPIRHVDQFGTPSAKHVRVYGNRGASGIDGVTSTALGVAAADRSRPAVLLIGDISLYHDMNGLLALRQHDLGNVTIVLFNNNGGGIFQRLPIARFNPMFTSLFLTPHGLDFAQVARLYDLDHVRADDADSFREQFTRSVNSLKPTIVEVQTDSAADEARRKAIVQQVRAGAVFAAADFSARKLSQNRW
jgi:2-succinyl-5-enolpyruvyl-6-hydroxy-3-cyclohexene-1-carboxylate synthase